MTSKSIRSLLQLGAFKGRVHCFQCRL